MGAAGHAADVVDMPAPVRVLCADDDPFVRTELVRALVAHPELTVVGVAVDAEAALRLAAASAPDVAIVGLGLGDAAAQGLGAAGVSVLLLAEPPLTATRRAADAAGARAVLDRTLGPERLADLVAALGAPAPATAA
jgi:DNA-binding NarL/FixJ family response regulator